MRRYYVRTHFECFASLARLVGIDLILDPFHLSRESPFVTGTARKDSLRSVYTVV